MELTKKIGEIGKRSVFTLCVVSRVCVKKPNYVLVDGAGNRYHFTGKGIYGGVGSIVKIRARVVDVTPEGVELARPYQLASIMRWY